MRFNKFRRNNIIIGVEEWPTMRKKPVLAVRIDGENAAYKVASFNNQGAAEWFCEIMEKFVAEGKGGEDE